MKPKNSCFLVMAIMVDLELKTAFEKFSFKSDNLERNFGVLTTSKKRTKNDYLNPKEKMLGIMIFC